MNSLPKLLSKVEEGSEEVLDLILERLESSKYAPVVGITGPPGSGKSTLIGKLARLFAGASKRLGILALDPASPFSGGSFLGDRIRMRDCEQLEGIYIRSVSSGAGRDLPRRLSEMTILFSVFGFDVVIIETPGFGQTETEIKHYVDLLLLTVPPLSGDDIQFLKSGILEVVDAYLVTKCDLPEAKEVADILERRMKVGGKEKPIFAISSLSGEGMEGLFSWLSERLSHSEGSLSKRVVRAFRDRVFDRIMARLNGREVSGVIEDLLKKRTNASHILEEVEKRWIESAFSGF